MALGLIAPGTPSAGQAVAALRPALRAEHWRPRARASEALGRFGPRASDAIPELRALGGDPRQEVRDAAAKALLAIGEGGST